MDYKVNGFNNLCRVFEIPKEFPKGYCFGGGLPVIFLEVDWFWPVPGVTPIAVSQEIYNEKIAKGEVDPEYNTATVNDEMLKETLINFLKQKNYIKSNTKYLVLCEFGLDFTFSTNLF